MNKQALSLEKEATTLRDNGKGLAAIEKYQQAKKLYEESGDLAKAAGCQHMIGVSYKTENDIDKALPAYKQAAADYKKAGDKLGPGRVARDAGIMYEYYDRLDEAEKYLLQSKAEFEALPSDKGVNQSASEATTRDAELGITLAKLGLIYIRLKKFDKAEPHLMEGLTLIRGAGHPSYEVTTLMHLAQLYMTTNHAGRMLANLEAALGLIYEHEMQNRHTRRLAQIWGLMAHGYLAHENKATAGHFAKKALDYIDTLSSGAQKPLLKDIDAEKLKGLF